MSNPSDHYWIVDQRPNEVYASKRQSFVAVEDDEYLAWLRDPLAVAGRVSDEAELTEVLRRFRVPPYHQVSTFTLVSRLAGAGLLTAAEAALNQDVSQKWRFSQATYVDSDHPEVVALLTGIGADVAAMLAPE